jgi:hypothetical protein
MKEKFQCRRFINGIRCQNEILRQNIGDCFDYPDCQSHLNILEGEKKMREWKKFSNDEIWTIWKGYCRTEFPGFEDPLSQCVVKDKPIRLTPLEIIRLVEELMDRLEIKENSNNL